MPVRIKVNKDLVQGKPPWGGGWLGRVARTSAAAVKQGSFAFGGGELTGPDRWKAKAFCSWAVRLLNQPQLAESAGCGAAPSTQ